MSKQIEIFLSPEDASDEALAIQKARIRSGLTREEFPVMKIIRRSIDARRKPVRIRLVLSCHSSNDDFPADFSPNYKDVSNSKEVAIIGSGPAGLFAALELLERGLKPVIFERGKDVRARRRDLAAIHKQHIVNPDSNYCFGEGGAGTYSDGKLYTRSTKRGDVKEILDTLVHHGADKNILIDAHPHIGTNKLPKIIAHIRETIIRHGGEVHFNSRLTDLKLQRDRVKAIKINDEKWLEFDQVILATGHSARDIFTLLEEKGILIENKPFAVGVRVEHPQKFIDQIQYHCADRGEYLPPSSYQLVAQIDGRGVYSFCMCPGGIIAPCATEQEEIVTNGWSPSKRNNPYANSGIVTQVLEDDLVKFESAGALKGLAFQKSLERKCWEAAGKTQAAPAQRLLDFIHERDSVDLPECSYQPGITSVRLDQLFPDQISRALRLGFIEFGRKMKGYLHSDAIVVAPESRTSSPIRIPRDKESMEHVEVHGLYPCGEGAGYAGGIISAAIDGKKIAGKCSEQIPAK